MKKIVLSGVMVLMAMGVARAVESPVLGSGYLKTPVPWTKSGAGLSLAQLFENKPLVNVTDARARFSMNPWELSVHFATADDPDDKNTLTGMLKYSYGVANTVVGGYVGVASVDSKTVSESSLFYGIGVGARALNFSASAGWLGFQDARVLGGSKDEQENEFFVNASLSIPGGFGIFAEFWNLSELDQSGWTAAGVYQFIGGLTLIGGWSQVSNDKAEGQAFAAISYNFSLK
ncbi:MAG: hypothetical protein V2G33_08065 [bacterium JZ-2024 1]